MRSDESIAIVICPECQARGKIKAEMIGRTATCPRCGKRVVLRREDETKTGLTAIEADDYRPQAARQPLVQPPVLAAQAMFTQTESDEDVREFVDSAKIMTIALRLSGTCLIIAGILIAVFETKSILSNPYVKEPEKTLSVVGSLIVGGVIVLFGFIQHASRIFIIKFAVLLGRITKALEKNG